MDVVGLAVHFNHVRLEVTAYFGEDGTETFDGIGVEDLLPVLGDEDQVDVELENTVSTVSDFA